MAWRYLPWRGRAAGTLRGPVERQVGQIFPCSGGTRADSASRSLSASVCGSGLNANTPFLAKSPLTRRHQETTWR